MSVNDIDLWLVLYIIFGILSKSIFLFSIVFQKYFFYFSKHLLLMKEVTNEISAQKSERKSM